MARQAKTVIPTTLETVHQDTGAAHQSIVPLLTKAEQEAIARNDGAALAAEQAANVARGNQVKLDNEKKKLSKAQKGAIAKMLKARAKSRAIKTVGKAKAKAKTTAKASVSKAKTKAKTKAKASVGKAKAKAKASVKSAGSKSTSVGRGFF